MKSLIALKVYSHYAFFCIICVKRKEWVLYPFFAFDATSHRRNVAIWCKRKRTRKRWRQRERTSKVCSHLTFTFAFESTSSSKFKHCINGNVNTNTQNGSEPILDVLHWRNVKRWRKRKRQVWTDLKYVSGALYKNRLFFTYYLNWLQFGVRVLLLLSISRSKQQ